MIRVFDIALSAVGLIVSSPLMVAAAMIVAATSRGPVIFAQTRMGRHKRHFTCYKLRTMTNDAPQAASHEVSRAHITKVGHWLRRTKLDELPQLWNVLRGDMSLVGPRPCLPGQIILIQERDRRGLYNVRPGITGPGQVAGLDMSEPERLARADEEWLKRHDMKSYFRFIAMTALGSGYGDAAAGNSALL